jgi:Flp pilus assembly protein TadD
MNPRRLSRSALLLGIALSGCSHVSDFNPFNREAANPAQVAAPDAATSVLPPLANASAPELSEAVRAAQLQRRNGDLAGATRTLSQLVLVAPDDPRVIAEYGKVLLDKGQITDAIAFLQRAAELAPADWTLHSALGVAYGQTSNYPAARASFVRALVLKPGEPSILNNFAMTQVQAGDLAGAEYLLTHAGEHAGTNPRIAENLALVRQLKASGGATAAPTNIDPGLAAAVAPSAQAQVASTPPAAAPAAVTPPPAAQAAPAPAAPPAQAVPVPAAPPPTSSSDVTGNTVASPAPVRQDALPVVMSTPIGPSGPVAAPAPRADQPTMTVAKIIPGRVTFVQVAAYATEERAAELVAKLEGLNARIMTASNNGQTFYRVRIGPLANSEEAATTLAKVQELGFTEARYVTEAASAPVVRSGTPSLRLSETSQ